LIKFIRRERAMILGRGDVRSAVALAHDFSIRPGLFPVFRPSATTPDHADFTLGSPEENDGSSQGIIIDWTPGDGQKGETVGVIAIISPAENNYQGRSVLEFSVENYPNDSGDEHADLLFSADDPSGAGCSDFICGSNTPVLDGASHLSLYDLIV
jgi:hypothetical protein